MFLGLANDKGLELSFIVMPKLPRKIEGDIGKIRQILINLLGNALKFTERGYVKLQAESVEEESGRAVVRIVVSDTGPGIEAADHDRIFGAFEQSGAGVRAGGVGLGLAICRQLARLMGGDLTRSGAIGVGSEFTFSFAAAVVSPAEEPHEVRIPIRLASDQEPPRVLVADDVSGNRDLMSALLIPMGFQVRLVSSGEDALVAEADWHPDLVLMDAQMPGIGGLESIRRLRARSSAAKIILITASGLGELRIEGLAAGADLVLFRPMQDTDLLEQIGHLLGTRFVYEDPDLAPAEAPRKDAALAPAVLFAALPTALLTELHDAAQAARVVAVEDIAKRVQSLSPQAAEAIRSCTRDFRFEALVAGIVQARRSADGREKA